MTPAHTRTGYTVRESKRARRVILKVSPKSGLEVVVPRGFDQAFLPDILSAKSAWIETQLSKLHPPTPLAPPKDIDLAAIGQRWDVQYERSSTPRISVSEHRSSLLMVTGDVAQAPKVSRALTGWLHRQAHIHLVPWLRRVSDEVDIPFQKASVRGQATRWASCSQAHNISVNRSLLFLPDHLVRHVFLHELAHIKHPDHSPKFWAAVAELEPRYKALEADVKSANHYVPQWTTHR